MTFQTRCIALVLFLLVQGVVYANSYPVVDINSATVEQLSAALVGIGSQKAQAIVAYRQSHGLFHSADELAKVAGIGTALIERNKDHIVVGSSDHS